MAGVTISGAGATEPDGTNVAVARQVGAMIDSMATYQSTNPGTGTAPAVPSGSGGELIITSNVSLNVSASSAYRFFVVSDAPLPNTAPVTISGGGAAGTLAVLGVRPVTFNAGGGSGTIVGGDSQKTISIGAGTNYAVYTGAGNDTIDLTGTIAAGRNTVEAGLAVTNNTVKLGAAPTQVRSTGNDAVSVGRGAATVSAVGAVVDTVSGGSGALTFIEGTNASQVNYTTDPNTGVKSAVAAAGSTTVIGGGAAGGLYRGGTSGANLLVGSAGAVTLQGAGNGDVLIATAGTGLQVLQAGAGNETLLGSLSTTDNVFSAGSGNTVIIAGSGSDRINAGTGSSTITGGGGRDLFVVDPRFSAGGHVTITDFVPGTDHVALQAYAAPNTASQLAAAAQRVGAGSQVTLSDGTTITFQGLASVTAGFFS